MVLSMSTMSIALDSQQIIETILDDETIADITLPEEEDQPAGQRNIVFRIILRALSFLGVLAALTIGVCILLYPAISNYVNTKNQSRVIEGYRSSVKTLENKDFSAYFAAARAYNERLAGKASTVEDVFQAGQRDINRKDDYWKLLDVAGDGLMGYVDVESLNIQLPIYHGTSEAALARGSGHIQGSSLPVGGSSTHAILTGHTGMPSAKLFTGIDRLKQGDTFTIHILNEEYTYQVDQIMTVLPYEVEPLGIINGGDYVTLLTCTPYGINTHRLLVRGKRIANQSKDTEDSDETAEKESLTPKEPGPLRRFYNAIVRILAAVVETVAVGIVSITEWGMDLLGIAY